MLLHMYFSLQQLEQTMQQIEATVIAEGDFLDILARIHCVQYSVFPQRCRHTIGSAVSARTAIVVLQVIFPDLPRMGVIK